MAGFDFGAAEQAVEEHLQAAAGEDAAAAGSGASAADAKDNIWTAAADGDVETVLYWLRNGVSPTAADDSGTGYTPLHAAASWAQDDALRVLLAWQPQAESITEPKAASGDGAEVEGDKLDTTDSVLITACERRRESGAGTDPDTGDDDGDTALHVCASAACVRSLLLAGADGGRPNEAGLVPLQARWQEEDEGDEGAAGAGEAAHALQELWYGRKVGASGEREEEGKSSALDGEKRDLPERVPLADDEEEDEDGSGAGGMPVMMTPEQFAALIQAVEQQGGAAGDEEEGEGKGSGGGSGSGAASGGAAAAEGK